MGRRCGRIGVCDGRDEGGDRTEIQPGWAFRLGTLCRETGDWEEGHS